MSELVIRSGGFYTDYFIVSRDGEPYGAPERGENLLLKLRGRVPSRYASGGINLDFERGRDEEGELTVENFIPWDQIVERPALLQFEGFVRFMGDKLSARGALIFGSLSMPSGVKNMLNYEGLSVENLALLSSSTNPALGTLRLW